MAEQAQATIEPTEPSAEPAGEASSAVSAATSTSASAPMTEPVTREPAKPDRGGFVWGTGRRKASVATVRIRPAAEKGQGLYRVNDRTVEDFFTELRDRVDAYLPLEVTKLTGELDVFCKTFGGGYAGQAGAVRLGLARALKAYDPQLEPILRDNELLTRDARRVERKKYGQPGARRQFQFSKR